MLTQLILCKRETSLFPLQPGVRGQQPFKWHLRSAGGWPLLETSSSQSEPRSVVLCSAFPGPRGIHNMIMTLTLLIVAKQPDHRPCGAQWLSQPSHHNIYPSIFFPCSFSAYFQQLEWDTGDTLDRSQHHIETNNQSHSHHLSEQISCNTALFFSTFQITNIQKLYLWREF